MLTLNADKSILLMIDIQEKLIPAIHNAEEIISNVGHLLEAVNLLNIPSLLTEQNPDGLGSTVSKLAVKNSGEVFKKMTFDACREPDFLGALKGKSEIVVVGCEAHVCVLQTVLSLLETDRKIFV
ncbi:MAG: isochorismatase family protein, partial [Sneathiella sp.]|nr:isochorismatase family protein [Sneathiella sp.]